MKIFFTIVLVFNWVVYISCFTNLPSTNRIPISTLSTVVVGHQMRRRSSTFLCGIVFDRMRRGLSGEGDRNIENDEDGNPPPLDIEHLDRDVPDFASLKPDDPLFLDMPWPTESGPAATAYGKHIIWKRRLSDGERMRWQKWAVYQRSMIPHKFDYSVDDYLYESMLQDLITVSETQSFADWEKASWKSVATGLVKSEEDEVQSILRAFYSSFNRRNFDDIRVLFLPDENAELTLPGYEKAVCIYIPYYIYFT